MSDENIEWEWEAFTVAACEAYEKGHAAQATHLWTRACEVSSSFSTDDPRRAASTNNRAIGCLISERLSEAAAGFAEAAAMWNRTNSWTEKMNVQPIARSSLYHLRMAERHQDAFATMRRSRNQQVLEGAQALTRFNQAITLLFLDEDDEADELLMQAARQREFTCGPNNFELAKINQVIAGRHEHAGNQAEAQELDVKAAASLAEQTRCALECWKDEQPAELNDPRRLLAAAHLTAIVHERDFM